MAVDPEIEESLADELGVLQEPRTRSGWSFGWLEEDPLDEERRHLLATSGLPERFRDSTLEPGGLPAVPVHWRMARAVQRLRAWVREGGGLYLYGDEARVPLAASAAADCIRKAPPETVRFVSEGDLFWLLEIRNIKNLRPQYRLSTYEDVEVLVLEGLGVRRLNAYMRDTLFDLFRKRFRAEARPRKTLLTGRPPPSLLEVWLRGEDPLSSGTELVTMFREVIGDRDAVGVLPELQRDARPASGGPHGSRNR